jgi:alkylation response protein AidB-like acyl-CoA dehydrogenase
MAARYAKEREQFGKPIFDNQGVSFLLADMGVKVELAKLMLLKACWLCDQKLPFSREAAMAKMYCTDVAMQVSTDAVQIFGGKGFLRENEVERFMRDSKILQIYEGTNQVQRMIVANYVAKEALNEQ